MPSVEATLFPYAVGAISALLAFLGAVMAWVGTQITSKIGGLTKEVKETNTTLRSIERDLRGELSRLDRRITRVEEHCVVIHPKTFGGTISD